MSSLLLIAPSKVYAADYTYAHLDISATSQATYTDETGIENTVAITLSDLSVQVNGDTINMKSTANADENSGSWYEYQSAIGHSKGSSLDLADGSTAKISGVFLFTYEGEDLERPFTVSGTLDSESNICEGKPGTDRYGYDLQIAPIWINDSTGTITIGANITKNDSEDSGDSDGETTDDSDKTADEDENEDKDKGDTEDDERKTDDGTDDGNNEDKDDDTGDSSKDQDDGDDDGNKTSTDDTIEDNDDNTEDTDDKDEDKSDTNNEKDPATNNNKNLDHEDNDSDNKTNVDINTDVNVDTSTNTSDDDNDITNDISDYIEEDEVFIAVPNTGVSPKLVNTDKTVDTHAQSHSLILMEIIIISLVLKICLMRILKKSAL